MESHPSYVYLKGTKRYIFFAERRHWDWHHYSSFVRLMSGRVASPKVRFTCPDFCSMWDYIKFVNSDLKCNSASIFRNNSTWNALSELLTIGSSSVWRDWSFSFTVCSSWSVIYILWRSRTIKSQMISDLSDGGNRLINCRIGFPLNWVWWITYLMWSCSRRLLFDNIS